MGASGEVREGVRRKSQTRRTLLFSWGRLCCSSNLDSWPLPYPCSLFLSLSSFSSTSVDSLYQALTFSHQSLDRKVLLVLSQPSHFVGASPSPTCFLRMLLSWAQARPLGRKRPAVCNIHRRHEVNDPAGSVGPLRSSLCQSYAEPPACIGLPS